MEKVCKMVSGVNIRNGEGGKFVNLPYFLFPCACIFLYMIFTATAVRNVVGIALIIYMMLLDSDKYYYISLFLFSSAQLINLNAQTSVLMLLMVLAPIKAVIVSRKIRFDMSIFISFALLVIFSIANYFVGSKEQIVEVIKHIFFTIFFIINYIRIKEAHGILKFYYNSIICISIGIICTGIASFIVYGFLTLTNTGRWMPAPEISVNVFAVIIAGTVINLLYICFVLGKRFYSIINIRYGYIILAVCIIFGLLTQSRAFILGVIVSFLCLAVLVPSVNMKRKFLAIILLALGLFFLSVILSPSMSSFIYKIISRFTEKDISNHRFDLWLQTITKMNSNPFFKWMGAGSYEYLQVTYEGAGKYVEAHNVFLETWVIFGIVGCLLLFMNYYAVIKKCLLHKMQRFTRPVMFTPVISLLSVLFFSHYFIGRSMSIIFLLCFCPLAIDLSAPRVTSGELFCGSAKIKN